jgi:hypothetical protein
MDASCYQNDNNNNNDNNIKEALNGIQQAKTEDKDQHLYFHNLIIQSIGSVGLLFVNH